MCPAFGIGSGTPYEAATWQNNVAATLVALVASTLLSRRKDFVRYVGASGARPGAERRSALRDTFGCSNGPRRITSMSR